MKTLVIGSRNIENFDISKYVPKDTDLIISGGAKGVDSIAEKYADDNRISKLIIRPKYDIYGKAAPIKRNEEMIDMADFVLIIWDGESRGTKYSIEYSKKKGKDIKMLNLKES